MKHSIPHDLGQPKAEAVAAKAIASYQEKYAEYSPTATWSGPAAADIAFSVKGIKLTGRIDVLADRIDIELSVPFLLRPFQGQAVRIVEGEIKRWIEKARAGEI